MTSWSAIQALPQAAPGAGVARATGERGLASGGDLSRRVLSFSINVLVALFYGIFLYAAAKTWFRTGSLVSAGLVLSNTLLVAFLLTRHSPVTVTDSVRNWILAPLSQILPLLLRPVASASWAVLIVSGVGQIAGLAVMIASLVALNRSIGVVAANRGIKTRGVYARVRHPLYSGEILFFVSFLLSNWSYPNALCVCALILAQLARSVQEEALLLRDERYAAYRAAVPYRLVPGVF